MYLSTISTKELAKYLKPGKDQIFLESQAKQLITLLDTQHKSIPKTSFELEEKFKNKAKKLNIQRIKDHKLRLKLMKDLIKNLSLSLEKDAPNAYFIQCYNFAIWLFKEKDAKFKGKYK